MNHTVTFENVPLTIVGRPVTTGASAPRSRLTDQDTEELTLETCCGKVKLVHFFTSLDTPVCDLQIREFNRRARELDRERVSVIGVSKDLPFAQRRFCETFGIRDMTLLSDYRYSSFGINYGVLIKEWNLLARGVIILDASGIVRYAQLVEEITHPPDFDDAVANLDIVLNASEADTRPAPSSGRALPGAKVTALPKLAADSMMARIPGWTLVDGRRIVREYTFKDFAEAKYRLDIISAIAEEQGHHPSFTLDYNRLEVDLTTHSAGSRLTEKDFTVAEIIDGLL